MEFIQIIECRTSKFDELTALEDEWRKATEGKRTLRRSIITRDRNDPERYLILAFFDSYDSAMANSNLPETTAPTWGCLPNWSRMSTIAACTAGSSTVLPCRVWKTTSTSSPARAGNPLSRRSWAFWESEPGVLNVKL